MKKLFYCFIGAFALISCSDNTEKLLDGSGDINWEILPEDKPNEVVKQDLFDKLNLDYPGLEKVKAYHEAGKDYYACYELLEYYRNRSNIVNTRINLINPSITATDQRIADQALEHRFYIRNFQESGTGENAVYYLFEKDGKIDWSYAPEGMDDQEFFSQKHRHQWFPALGKAYRVTKDEKYFESWKETYLDWLKTYPCPEGKVSKEQVEWYGLQPTERLDDQMNLLQYFIQSVNFTPEFLSEFLLAFSDHVECVRNNYFTDGGNIEAAMYRVVTTAGILMPEFKNASEWLTEGSTVMGQQVKDQFLNDGVQNELDPSYHIGVVDGFYSTYQLASQNNKLSIFPENYIEQLKNSARFVMDIIYPNYTLDNFNDTRSVSWTKSVLTKNLKKYVEMFPEDAELLWFAYEGKSGTKPSYNFKMYDDAGYYILRNGWDKSSTMMVLKNNKNVNNKWHCQPDNGTFGLYHNERNFFPDAGVFSYGGTSESNAERAQYLATKNHNTMTCNGKTIANGFMNGGMLKNEVVNGNTQLIVVENKSYQNLTHRRSVFFVENKFFVLVDEGYGNGNSDKVELNFHLLSDADATKKSKYLNKENREYGAYTTFDSNNMIIRTFAETNDGLAFNSSETTVSNAIGEVNGVRASYQLSITKPADGAARFITIIYPFDKVDELSKLTFDASFKDNEGGTAGAFHADGVDVMVKINDKEYNLKYKL